MAAFIFSSEKQVENLLFLMFFCCESVKIVLKIEFFEK